MRRTVSADPIQTVAGSGTILGNIKATLVNFAPEGTLTIDGNFTTTAGTTFNFDDLANDVIRTTGTLTLHSDLTIDLSGADLSAGNYTLFISDTGINGRLSVSNFTGYNDEYWFIDGLTNTGDIYSISITAIPEPSVYALALALGSIACLLIRRHRIHR